MAATRRIVRLTGDQHALLTQHLLPEDGLEAVAVALCGRHSGPESDILSVHRLALVPHADCDRHSLRISWPTVVARPLIEEAAKMGMGILKIHSHPGSYEQFSEVDDASDAELFPSVHGWTDDGQPHASAIMLPNGRIFARMFYGDGSSHPVDRVAVAGDDLLFFDADGDGLAVPEEQRRTHQTFGEATTRLLGRLHVGVVGCSGTGGWVGEQLCRLGVRRLTLVDPDTVERKNLNRIVGTQAHDAVRGRSKVDALAEMFRSYGTGTRVDSFQSSVLSREVITVLAECDVLFGCVDSIEGRDVLNRIAVFYTIPYFDLGIQLRADGRGGIETVCGSVHYLLPDGSSLMSRGVYTPDMLRSESLRRTSPEQYASEREAGYIRGITTGAPAVISVNGFFATMAINEMLARLHPYRDDSNSTCRWQQFDLVNSFWRGSSCSEPCQLLARSVGRGDAEPLLGCALIEA
jgi:hypothetical protein